MMYLSRNKRIQKKTKLIQVGIKVSNNVREAIILEKENGNDLWEEAIQKEMDALNKAIVFHYASILLISYIHKNSETPTNHCNDNEGLGVCGEDSKRQSSV